MFAVINLIIYGKEAESFHFAIHIRGRAGKT